LQLKLRPAFTRVFFATQGDKGAALEVVGEDKPAALLLAMDALGRGRIPA